MKYNIGKIRRFFLMPFSCKYNAWVRDTKAWIEMKLKAKDES